MNQNRKYIKAEKRVAIVLLCFSVIAGLAFTLWAGPALATWAVTGQWPQLPYGRALVVAVGTAFSVAHATRHWPLLVREAPPATCSGGFPSACCSPARWRWPPASCAGLTASPASLSLTAAGGS